MHPFLFLSYRTLDLEFALRLAAELKNAGLHVWMDRFDIPPGSDGQQEIQTAVDHCAAMICVLTPEYAVRDTTRNYCMDELARAYNANKPVFPVLLREIAPSDRPLQLERLQHVDFRDWHSPERFADRVAALQTEIRHRIGNTPFGEAADVERRYLTNLIADLKSRRGVFEYVELTAESRALVTDGPARRPGQTVVEAWGLDPEFDLLATGTTPTPRQSPAELGPPERLARIQEALLRFPRIVLTGEPGTGKSTSLRRLVLECAEARLRGERGAPLPVLASLPLWRDGESPVEFLSRFWPLPTGLTGLLRHGEARLYLDGLNEMGSGGPKHARQLREWIHSSTDAPASVIVTCRSRDYREIPGLQLDLPEICLRELEPAQIRKFAAGYLVDPTVTEAFLTRVLPADAPFPTDPRDLGRLARNPYLLTALLAIHAGSPEAELPQNMGLLLNRLTRVLWKREEQRQTAGWISHDEMEPLLGRLAFQMIDTDQPVEVGRGWALAELQSGGARDAPSLVQACHSASLLTLGPETVQFTHQLVQEYFAATELGRIGVRERLKPLMTNLDPTTGSYRLATKWDQVVMALCGLVPERVDEMLIEIANTDTSLAVRCLRSGITGTGKAEQVIISFLIADLTDRWDDDRHWPAADALGELGEPALPALWKLLRDPTLLEESFPWIRVIASKLESLFQRIGDPAVTGLEEILREGHPASREIARKSLTAINTPRAKIALARSR